MQNAYVWNRDFRNAFRAYFEGELGVALVQCCHHIDCYVENYPDSIVAEWDRHFIQFENDILGSNLDRKVSHPHPVSRKSFKRTIPSKIADFLPKNILNKIEKLSEQWMSVVPETNSVQPGNHNSRKCTCPVPTDNELVRWYILKAFVVYKMILCNKITHEDNNVIRAKTMLQYAAKLIHVADLCHEKEFAHLKRECKIKMMILYTDFLDRPWEARSILKRLRQQSTDEMGKRFEDRDDAFLDEYTEKIEYRCMMWYIRKKSLEPRR